MTLKHSLILLYLGLQIGAMTASAATFGTPVSVLGAASDLILDESRRRLYVVNSTANRIDVYDTAQRTFLTPIATDTLARCRRDFPARASISTLRATARPRWT